MQKVNTQDLQNILTDFQIKSSSLQLIGTRVFRYIYKVESEGKTYTLRVFTKERSLEQIEKDVAILEYLESKNFPSTRIIKNSKGEKHTYQNGISAMLTSYIQGQHPDLSPIHLSKMGELTGRLHRISYENYPYPSPWSMENEFFTIKKKLSEIDIQKIEHNELIPHVLEGLTLLPSFKNLPQAIIHSDIHPHNTIMDKNNQYYFIDWDDAGVGTAILDLGYVLSQVCIRFEKNAPTTPVWKKELAEAFLNGYQSIRPLNKEEKNYLIYAMQFAALDYTIHYWAMTVDQQNWARYEFMKQQEKNILAPILGN